MTNATPSMDADVCPCLVPVVNDFLHTVRTPVYCHRPNGALRVPAQRTLIDVCLAPAYRDCAGYRAAIATSG